MASWLLTLLAGMIAGVVLSAPVGPMGALGALQAAKGNVRGARMLALGVCGADSFLALLATLGMGLPIPTALLTGCGMILMLGMAWYLWRHADAPVKVISETAGFGIGVSATLFHPGNLVAFALVFSWLHARSWITETWTSQAMLVLGVVIGTSSLWALLLYFAARSQELSWMERLLPRFQRILAVVCVCAAVAAAYELSGL